MKKLILFVLAVMVAVMTIGCTAYKAYNNVQKMAARTEADINLQTTPPDIKANAQYAVTPLAKELYTLLDAYITNPDTIPAKLMDPATNPEAAKRAEKDIKEAKKGIIKSFSKSGGNKATMVQVIKKTEEDLRKPYWEITSLPNGAYEGIMRNVAPLSAGTTKFKASKTVFIRFSTKEKGPEEVRAELMAALDSFLTKDGKWVKRADILKHSYDNAILTLTETIDLQRDILKHYEGDARMKGDYDRTLREIRQNENMIANMRKMQAKNISPITMYKYTWNKAGKITFQTPADMTSVVINVKANNITLAFNQIINE